MAGKVNSLGSKKLTLYKSKLQRDKNHEELKHMAGNLSLVAKKSIIFGWLRTRRKSPLCLRHQHQEAPCVFGPTLVAREQVPREEIFYKEKQ